MNNLEQAIEEKVNQWGEIHSDPKTQAQIDRRVLFLDVTKGLVGAVIVMPIIYLAVYIALAL
tara:strand:+ start:1053 stop:1238 length:186 start_codon:yes stop_codon:yes gene_type:complete